MSTLLHPYHYQPSLKHHCHFNYLSKGPAVQASTPHNHSYSSSVVFLKCNVLIKNPSKHFLSFFTWTKCLAITWIVLHEWVTSNYLPGSTLRHALTLLSMFQSPGLVLVPGKIYFYLAMSRSESAILSHYTWVILLRVKWSSIENYTGTIDINKNDYVISNGGINMIMIKIL